VDVCLLRVLCVDR